ncbi:tetratricopeptide repeat protein [Falsiruegeria mediterranea]
MKTFLFVLLLAIAPFGVLHAQDAPSYVGSETCRDCHEDAAQEWDRSHHAQAWMTPSAQSVKGDFDGTRFVHDGMEVEFSTDGSDYFAKVTEKDGVTTDYKAHTVAGIEPLQQYLFETGNGRLQSFDVFWDTERQEWGHLYPDQDLPPNDGLHWTGPYKNWNARCAECHATGYKRNYGPQTRSYRSTQAEIGVGCEACHGPASSHIEWTTGKTPPAGLTETGFAMDWTDKEAAIQQCASCHSRREALEDGNPLPGTPYNQTYALSLMRPGLYYPDGQILDEVYVYGSFLQSKMYAKGVTCMNCHEPHSGELRAEGTAVCTQCHSLAGNPDFPSLPIADYDSPEHHHHPEGSEGAQCRNCHMPEKTYMQVDVRSDHSFRIPRPDLSSETGAPDTCTTCHEDKDPAWAASRIAEWFPDTKHRQPHFGSAFARAQIDPIRASGDLLGIALDEGHAGIVRATALYLLQGAASADLAGQTANLLGAPDPLVRASAASLQQAAPPEERLQRLMPVLGDPVRSVRIAAAKAVLNVPQTSMTRSQQAVVGAGVQDWQRSLRTRLDFPETHLVLGGLALTMRNAQAAERAFREVVEMDPQRAEAWPMLVRLAHINGGPQAARRVLIEALNTVPGDPALLQLQEELSR